MTQDASGTRDVHAYLTQAEQSHFRNQEVEMVDHWQGRDNLLWRVRTGNRDFVFKLFLEAGQVRSERQLSGQERFAQLGLAPRPLWQERQPHGLPRPILVYEWLDGEALELAAPMHRDAFLESIVRVHTEDLGDYNRFSPHPVNLGYFWRIWQASRSPIRDWLTERGAIQLSTLLERLWDQVEALMAAALPRFGETAPALIHGDLSAENALLHRGQAVLVDWEMFGIGDPAQEIARFLFFSGQILDESIQNQWMERYLARVGDPGMAARIELYRRTLAFHSLTFLFNGVRKEIASNPAQAAALSENRQFLVQTSMAALEQAAMLLLSTTLSPQQADLQTEVDQLFSL